MSGPRVEVDKFVVYPTRYDEIPFVDKESFCLTVVNGHAWGWSVRKFHGGQQALNKKGEWIFESRGSGRNKPRRWSQEEAISLAVKYVDTMRHGHYTVDEACEVKF